MPPHRTDPRIGADPRIDSCPELQPSSDATPCLWHGDVEAIHEGRALRQRQDKPGLCRVTRPFLRSRHAQSNLGNPSQQAVKPT